MRGFQTKIPFLFKGKVGIFLGHTFEENIINNIKHEMQHNVVVVVVFSVVVSNEGRS